MEPIRAVYDGKNFVPTAPVKLEKDRQAIVVILDEAPFAAAEPWRAFFGVLPPDACAEIEEALCGKLGEAEAEAVNGEEGMDFSEFANVLRERIHERL